MSRSDLHTRLVAPKRGQVPSDRLCWFANRTPHVVVRRGISAMPSGGQQGWLDRLMGSSGLQGGRRHPAELLIGDALDSWLVLEVERRHRLLLLAEMKTLGEALPEFSIYRRAGGECDLQQKMRFLPRGLWGPQYRGVLYPFHQWIFRGMLRGLANTAGTPIIGRPQRITPKLPQACRTGVPGP